MKKGRFSEEQIIGVLKRHEAGQKVADLAREHGVSEATMIFQRLQSFLLQIDVTEVVIHKADEPDAVRQVLKLIFFR